MAVGYILEIKNHQGNPLNDELKYRTIFKTSIDIVFYNILQ